MLLQRYYNIGKGVIQLYGNVRFISSNNVIVPFTSTCKVSFQPPAKKELIGLCVYYYFSQNMVVNKYLKILQIMNIISFKDVSYHLVMSLLWIKNAFAAQMVLSPNCILLMLQKSLASAGNQIKEACRLYPWMNIFQDEYIQN